MSGEKKRSRWRRALPVREENLVINSKSSTTTTKTEEEQHTEKTRRKWYRKVEEDIDDDERDDESDIRLSVLLPTETISEKIDRVIRKIDAWTNETSTTRTTTTNHNNTTIKQQTSFSQANKPLFSYEKIQRRPYHSNLAKPAYSSLIHSFRRRCSSSTYSDQPPMKAQQVSAHRPYSMAFIDDPSPLTTSQDHQSSQERATRRTRAFHRQGSLEPNRYQQQRRSMYSSMMNPTSFSSMYGSDFFYPAASEQEQHDYDNLTFTDNPSHHPCEPFPTILLDCQRCSRSVDRTSQRDISCQVPSDEEFYQDVQTQRRRSSRYSPVYVSPRASPTLCPPPLADTLLAPYHSRRKNSQSSYANIHNRSRSVPSSSPTMSSTESRPPFLLPSLCPLPVTSDSNLVPSTNTLLRSIKTSIHAMKKRLKDIRRLSEWDSNVTIVLDDYIARSSQELTVSKGQHVRIIQKQPPHAPDWCLIRVLNDHYQHNQSSPSSLAASSTAMTSVVPDLTLSSPSKYTEGLVPAVVLKSAKSSSSTIQLPPPLTLPIISSKSEQDELSNQTDDVSQHRSPPFASQISKRKSSFRRILKNPARRLSLKDNSTNRDVKPTSPTDIVTTSTSIVSEDSDMFSPVIKRPPLPSHSTNTRKIKAFTFTNTDDLTSFPDSTSSLSKSIDTDGIVGLFKMTDASSSSSNHVSVIAPIDDFESDVIGMPLSLDLRSQLKLSSDGDLLSPAAAPINVVSGFSASDFHIPTALSITSPPIDDSSSASMPSSSTITVISNDSPSEPTDEVSVTDVDQSALSSLTINEEPVDDRTKYGEKRRHNIMELIETEKEYVKDLALIVEGYMNILENDKEIKKPANLCGRERVVFGNVQKIYEFHRDTFLPQLEQCIENPDLLGRLFATNRFSPYVRYCENKPRSEYIVSEHHDYFEEVRKKLGQKLLVSDLLIKPVQRIMRYQLLLKEILKATERMGHESRAIRSALQVMIDVPQQANDMMNVGRIKDLPTNVHQLGELKLQDMLLVSEPITTKDTKDAEKKLKERRVFLFQQSMIFCEEIPAKDKYSSPNYIYKCELKINKLQHKEFKRNKELCQFTLVEVDAGNARRVVCQCKDDEQYELWVTNVNKVLQRQMDLIIALTNPTAALQKEQDSSMLLFTPSSRSQIKKSMSDRSSTFSEISSTCSPSKPAQVPTKKTSLSFNLFDSILSRSITKPLSINTTKKKQPTTTQLPASCPQETIEIPEQARCLYNYNAIKDDEICVHRGDYVQMLAASADNRWLVRRYASRTSPTAQGWLPSFVLGRKNPNLSSTNTSLSASSSPTVSLSANSLNHI